MTPALSIYLDLLRLLAAAVVFLGHVGTQRVSGGLLHQFARYGEAAVDVFFVLSGFVIAHVTATRETIAGNYAVNRLARVYSVVLPALLLGALLDHAGVALDPALYTQVPGFEGPATPRAMLASGLFLDQIWFLASQPGSNRPFWSLAFEAWYYLAFGLLLFAPRAWRWPLTLAALALAGPKIALLFPLWLLGVLCQRLCTRPPVSEPVGWALLLLPVLALVAWPDPFTRACFPFEVLDLRTACLLSLLQDYGIGLLVVVHLLGIRALSDRLGRWLGRIAVPVRWLAGASFTLYLLHYPLLHFLVAASPWPAAHWATRALVLIGTPLLILAVASLSERRKQGWRRVFDAVVWRRRSAS